MQNRNRNRLRHRLGALDDRVLALFRDGGALTRFDVVVGLEQEFGFIVGILGAKRSIGRLIREGLIQKVKNVGGADTGWAVQDAYRTTHIGRSNRHVAPIPLTQKWLQSAIRHTVPPAYRRTLGRLR